ncbi:MAG: methylmalonyl Co-A mutase-associated GTPase MeaB [Alphaproteobacteria bacterium]|nr:methylmalonyl Co-A mutase-associated GTPase MeaB [Alphaproteobacteria bacterium]
MQGATLPELSTLKSGDKRAIARALAAIETQAESAALAALLDTACADARAHVIGLTGPPGVGKSTLTNVLLARARARGETVGVIAVDPSSRRTGGALLGDRARIATDPSDRGVFVRSMAARDRLGGLSDQTVAAMVLMRAIYDLVLVESVGIGQSEADISFVADTVLLCVQPGSGDSLQFMKAGVTELPDVVAVTKADMGEARRTRADVEGALTLYASERRAPVVLVAATRGEGLGDLDAALADHRIWLMEGKRLVRKRHAQEDLWVERTIRARFGSVGLRAARGAMARNGGPFGREHAISNELLTRFNG